MVYCTCLENLLMIMSQLDGKEEASVTLKLHLFNDPSRFLISRLLDPHCLGYDWPFGGLIWSFNISTDDKEDVSPDNIFILDAIVLGAGWDSVKGCLVQGEKSGKLSILRGVPINYKDKVDQEDTLTVPVHSCYHSDELFKIPLKFEVKDKEFWERQNISIRLGEKL